MSSLEENRFESPHYLKQLLEIQQEVIANIALTTDLHETLAHLCSGIERIFSATDAKSSVLLLKGEQLRHGAAPSLPREYCDIIDGVTIGPSIGSCGTVAFTKTRYIAEDINSDPKWVNFKSLALSHDLQACWSTPIISTDSKVLGTFALYYAYPRSPSSAELSVIDRFSHLTGLAIEKHLAFQRESDLNEKLKYSHSKIETITQVLPDQLFIYDEDAHCVDFYGSQTEHNYRPEKHLIGRLIGTADGVEYCSCHEAIAKTLRTGELHMFEYQFNHGAKARFFESRITPIEGYGQESAEKAYVLWLARDITDRKEAEEKIEELAYHDLLTGLPNRRFLLNQLVKVIEAVKGSKKVGALLYLDLDNFKGVNDSLGHSAGDSLLKDICTRLGIKLNPHDTFARIGGDEFVIMLSHHSSLHGEVENHAADVADQLMKQLKKPFVLCGREVVIEASIGITLVTPEELHADEVLMRADTAMYSAKRSADKRYCFFDPALHESIKNRLALENELKEGIRKREIITHFQPQLGPNGQLLGVEALVRWLHPERGMIPPLSFISIAEEIGVIDSLQKIVMEDSCALVRMLRAENLVNDKFSVSINVSAMQFKNAHLSTELVGFFAAQNVSPCHVTLELTESMLVEGIDNAVNQMRTLKQQGFRLSIDDFGTGYSSLAYLQTFPIDELKIDKSFVDNMGSESIGTGIVDTIIALAKHMNFEVVAEGVEHACQVDYFKRADITSMQGYYFAAPMSSDDLHAWLHKKYAQC